MYLAVSRRKMKKLQKSNQVTLSHCGVLQNLKQWQHPSNTAMMNSLQQLQTARNPYHFHKAKNPNKPSKMVMILHLKQAHAAKHLDRLHKARGRDPEEPSRMVMTLRLKPAHATKNLDHLHVHEARLPKEISCKIQKNT